MRKTLIVASVVVFGLCLVAWSSSTVCAQGTCATIKSGTITDSSGNAVNTGYDVWGYNYQAHLFNGIYDNFTRPATPFTDDDCDTAPYGCVNLEMKWNDAWLSNLDCDHNGKLDRPLSYVGSGAWTTNHMSGSYEYTDDNGRIKEAHWTSFVKIVAVPEDAVCTATVSGQCTGNWTEPDGTVIGPAIWGQFAIVQDVYNDPVGGYRGLAFKSPLAPGFGIYKQ